MIKKLLEISFWRDYATSIIEIIIINLYDDDIVFAYELAMNQTLMLLKSAEVMS